MITLRSFLFLCIFFIAIIVCSIYVVLFGKWVGRSGALGVSRSWSHFSLGMLKRICGLDYQVSGLENIPNEPCILMCKHQSTWETVSVPGLVPRSQVWVLKQELMQIPSLAERCASSNPLLSIERPYVKHCAYCYSRGTTPERRLFYFGFPGGHQGRCRRGRAL